MDTFRMDSWSLSNDVADPLLRGDRLGVEDGVSVSFDIDMDSASFVLNVDGNHCLERNQWGDNNCHWNWGEVVTGDYSVVTHDTIVGGDTMEGHLTVRIQRSVYCVFIDLSVCVVW